MTDNYTISELIADHGTEKVQTCISIPCDQLHCIQQHALLLSVEIGKPISWQALARHAIAKVYPLSEHTRYVGKPYLTTLTGLSEVRAHILEALAEIFIGRGLYQFNRPVGAFLITSGICFGILIFLERLKTNTKSRNTSDALVEQSVNMQSVRRFRGR